VRRLALALAAVAVTGGVPAAAGAVLPGPNGPLVFTSGRDDGLLVLSDSHAQIWFLSGPNGGAQRLTTLGLSHHRHASWSPDRTKIAYARGPDDGTPFDGPWDIYVQDLSDPGSAPLNITSTPNQNEDRPTWSPDGTRIAYAGVDAPASTSWDIWVRPATVGGAATRIADDASAGMGSSGQFSRPQWSPDGDEIYYGKIIAVTPQNYDIYRAASDGSDVATGGTPIVAGSANTYQAAVSPDGSQLCFTLQDPMTGKDVYTVSSAPAGSPTARTSTNGSDEYECAWSPDGTKIAFVRGAFGAGEILMVDSSGSTATSPVTNVAGRFDGNPEWTRNPPPTCSNGNAAVAFNSFATIPLPCADTPDPPGFGTNSPFGPDIVTPPGKGVLGGISNDSVIYTPNVNFRGSDSFTFKSDDGTSDSNIAKIQITVAGPGSGGGGGATVESLTVSPRRWRRGSKLPHVSAAPVGTTIGVGLSAAGRVKLRFKRARPGRRVGGRCVKPTARNRNRRRCTRYVMVRPALFFNGKQGANSMRFQGRLNRRRRLPLGRYRLFATVTADGQTSPALRVSFRIVRR
jgi:Tol biopolymer transport system component